MNRPPPSNDSGFKHSSVPGWHHSGPGRGLAPAPVPAPPKPRRAVQQRQLSSDAHAWLSRLPPRYQPLATARQHPHIINRLSELWPQHQALQAYLQELMLSTRPGRGGFAFEVLTELCDLQTLLGQERTQQRAAH
jgi:hypothetical protein